MKFHFDQAAADKAIIFFEHFLHHTKGRWYGQPFQLMPWQRDALTKIFGWKRPDGTRRYRMVYIEIPKKDGKSEFAAGIDLYLTLADGEPAAEVYSLAGDRDQAAIIFRMAKTMVLLNPELEKRCEIFKHAIFVEKTMSRFEVLSRESGTKHGQSPSGISFDELHVQKSRDLWDTVTEGTSARTQPLTIAITTAGWDRTTICYEQHVYAVNVRDGVIKDDEFLPIIYAADEEDDWKDPEVWKKANPALGVTKTMEYMAKKCQQAQDIPGYLNTFLRLHLNIWTEQATAWLHLEDWEACANGVSLEEMDGRFCFAGIDLSSTRDLTALDLLFPPESEDEPWKLIPRFYMPGDNIKQRQDESKAPYVEWAQEGHIQITPGNVVDYDHIRKDIEQLGLQIQFRELALDRWNSTQLMTQLGDDGLMCVPFGQGFASMSGPSKEFEKLVLSRQIQHDGNPVMTWMVSNVAVKDDPAGNIKPDKARSREKIDGVVAAIMALGRAIADDSNAGPVEYTEVVMV